MEEDLSSTGKRRISNGGIVPTSGGGKENMSIRTSPGGHHQHQHRPPPLTVGNEKGHRVGKNCATLSMKAFITFN